MKTIQCDSCGKEIVDLEECASGAPYYEATLIAKWLGSIPNESKNDVFNHRTVSKITHFCSLDCVGRYYHFKTKLIRGGQ